MSGADTDIVILIGALPVVIRLRRGEVHPVPNDPAHPQEFIRPGVRVVGRCPHHVDQDDLIPRLKAANASVNIPFLGDGYLVIRFFG